MENDIPPTGPWGRIGGWVREEKFWRDVFTRVLAGVFTAAIIYAGALLLGYLHTPEIGAGLLLGLGIFACAGLVAGSLALLRSARSRARSGAVGGARIALAIVLLLAAGGIAAGVVADLLRS